MWKVRASEEENLSFYHSWSFSNNYIIYQRKIYNCIFAITATREAKNGPQQNHKFIKPLLSSVVALASTQQHKNINWYLNKFILFSFHSFQLLLLSFSFGCWLLNCCMCHFPFTGKEKETKTGSEFPFYVRWIKHYIV